jgi:hypothetical protein
VPSGQLVVLQDIIWNSIGPEGPLARFRFLAPAIARDGGTVGFETASADLLHLCQSVVLTELAQRGAMPARVSVSMGDRAVVFGDSDPEATQYFEMFQIDGDTCIWEAF